MIAEEKIAEVRERAGIVEVISDYISLKKSGANFQGLCPFHGEKTPSFNVNPARGIFHCFGCGVGGNAVTFVMKMEGISFPEAVKLLAKRVGVEIDERPPSAAEMRRKDEKEQQLAIVALAAGYYADILSKDPAGEVGRRYLAGRGVDSSLFAPYRLGYAADSWDGLASFLKQRGVGLEQVEKLGLIKRKSQGSGYFDLFRNRLMFTIANVYGQPIGFGGRVLDNSLPKYINSPESPIYLKSEVLFGADQAKQAMREQRAAVIVEGYFDHLALYRAGITNVVATCGTALTKGHLQVVRRYADKIYLLFDGDSAGKKATLKAMELILAEQLQCHVIELPPGDDPDSFLAKHAAADFTLLLDKARSALDYYLRLLVSEEDTGTVTGKKAVADRFRELLHKVADPVERDLYSRELARVLAVDLQALGRMGPTAGGPAAATSPRNVSGVAESLIALLFRYPEIAGEFRQSGAVELLPPELRGVAVKILETVAAGEKPDCAAIIDAATASEQIRSLAALLVDDSHLADIDPGRALTDFCRSLERGVLKAADAKGLRNELLRLDSDSPRYWEILETLNGLRNRKSQLS